jgi:hypothetical protein
MTATTPARRALRFSSLDEVVRDAENLQAKGYDRAGNWDLAQVCTHLTEWMRFPMDGFPRPPLPVRMALWMMRVTIGKAALRKTLDSGTMRAGGPTMPVTVSGPGGDATAAVAKLKETAARFQAHTGPIHPSPLFGAMDKDTATRLQLVHCAHHLSFLVPKG